MHLFRNQGYESRFPNGFFLTKFAHFGQLERTWPRSAGSVQIESFFTHFAKLNAVRNFILEAFAAKLGLGGIHRSVFRCSLKERNTVKFRHLCALFKVTAAALEGADAAHFVELSVLIIWILALVTASRGGPGGVKVYHTSYTRTTSTV